MRSHLLRAAAGNVSAAPIVTSNLALHYDFGDTNCWNQSGTAVTDLTGNGNNSTLPSSNVSYGSGQGGHLSKANAGAVTLSTDVFPINGANPFALEYWVNHDPLASNQHALFQDWYYHYPLYSGVPAYQYNAGVGYWQQTNYGVAGEGMNGSGTTGGSPGPLSGRPDSTITYFESNYYTGSSTGWEQLVFSRESTSTNGFKVYRNASNIYTGTNSINYDCRTTPSNYVILIRQRNLFKFQGGVAIFRMYTGAGLTSTEVTQNYNAQKARFGLS
jgi:hypothetical protein